jgi:hypothetical protein
MFDANFIDAQHQADALTDQALGGASGSMPRSIFAIRSWCFRIIVTMAIAPPTMIATIGTSNPPKPMIESTSLTDSLRKPTTISQRPEDQQPTTGFLVELTGIEPVASWLQTRRSPS